MKLALNYLISLVQPIITIGTMTSDTKLEDIRFVVGIAQWIFLVATPLCLWEFVYPNDPVRALLITLSIFFGILAILLVLDLIIWLVRKYKRRNR